ncbi:MAG: hypothetical protein A2Z74_07000 [Chloroflexi bacterium RBG_13_46_9]|jgi:hypothetical protein|nr:MAG: hypothetical protein A2Z74_07000 [Chloroflexi bacterium RBG_13_46_9]
MSQSSQPETAVKKLLDFAEFFLSLGDMKQADMLFSIANRDPEFADYFETITESIETPIDFFRVYADWAIGQIREENTLIWSDIIDAYTCAEKYSILKLKCEETTVLWDILDRIVKHGGKQ